MKIKCNFKQCFAGMGVAGNGCCFLGGNPEDKHCPAFIDEDEKLKEMEKKGEKDERKD